MPDSPAQARAEARRRISASRNRRRLANSYADPVAFPRSREDNAHRLDGNPNTAKRHAAKLDNSPRFTPRQYAPGAGRDAQRHYMPALETSWQGTPSLPPLLTKRVPTRGDA